MVAQRFVLPRKPINPALRVIPLVRGADGRVGLAQQLAVRLRALDRDDLLLVRTQEVPPTEVEQQLRGQCRAASPLGGIATFLVVERDQQRLLREDEIHDARYAAARPRWRLRLVLTTADGCCLVASGLVTDHLGTGTRGSVIRSAPVDGPGEYGQYDRGACGTRHGDQQLVDGTSPRDRRSGIVSGRSNGADRCQRALQAL
jgi:hypothetical protein